MRISTSSNQQIHATASARAAFSNQGGCYTTAEMEFGMTGTRCLARCAAVLLDTVVEAKLPFEDMITQVR